MYIYFKIILNINKSKFNLIKENKFQFKIQIRRSLMKDVYGM